MADDIVTRLQAHRDIDNDRCCECGHWTSHDDDCMIGLAADEIERLTEWRANATSVASALALRAKPAVREPNHTNFGIVASGDIVTRLHEALEVTYNGWPLLIDAADEIERLRRWRAEAITVIGDWEAVWEAAGRPGVLGQSKSLGLLGELGRLDDEIERLRSDVARLGAFLHPIGEQARRG